MATVDNTISLGDSINIFITLSGGFLAVLVISIKEHINFINKVLNVSFILDRVIDKKVFESDLSSRHAEFVGTGMAHGTQTIEMIKGCFIDYFIGPILRETPQKHLSNRSILEHLLDLSQQRSFWSYILDSKRSKLLEQINTLIKIVIIEIKKMSDAYDFVKLDNFSKDLSLFEKYLNETRFLDKIDIQDIKKEISTKQK